MAELFRDTVIGHLLRFVTGKKVFLYEEEKNPELWKQYIQKEKSANVAVHGQVEAPEGEQEKNEGSENDIQQPPRNQSPHGSTSSASTAVGDNAMKDLRLGKSVDQEKGKDVLIVGWWGPDDSENPRNWSRPKRFWVTFCICFLTFSVYIGSAIYSAGIMGVVETFGVSQVAATLGLTLFVAGILDFSGVYD